MREVDVYTGDKSLKLTRSELSALVLNESSLTCDTLRQFQRIIEIGGTEVVLVIPDYQYKEGLRGWAKVQILASVTDRVKGVLPLDPETASKELKKDWAKVYADDTVVWEEPISQVSAEVDSKEANFNVSETTDPFDKEMMDRAKGEIEKSNCWLDPAGCVFVKDRQIIMEATSTSYNQSNCPAIPISFKDLHLKEGERMFFCTSTHAERVGVTTAQKEGIPLQGSTIYISKFPCSSCAKAIIDAGVNTVVFEKDSYGVKDAQLFEEHNIKLLRVRY